MLFVQSGFAWCSAITGRAGKERTINSPGEECYKDTHCIHFPHDSAHSLHVLQYEMLLYFRSIMSLLQSE